MAAMRLPTDRPPGPQTIGEIAADQVASVKCYACNHVGELDVPALVAGLGAETLLIDVQRRLRCSKCGCRTGLHIMLYRRP